MCSLKWCLLAELCARWNGVCLQNYVLVEMVFVNAHVFYVCQPIDDELWFTAFSWHFVAEVLFWQSRQTSTGRTNQPHGRWMLQPPLAKKKKKKRKLMIFWWSISRSCSRVWWNIHSVKYTFHAVKTSGSFELKPVAPEAKQTSYSRLNVILLFSSKDAAASGFMLSLFRDKTKAEAFNGFRFFPLPLWLFWRHNNLWGWRKREKSSGIYACRSVKVLDPCLHFGAARNERATLTIYRCSSTCWHLKTPALAQIHHT